MCFQSPAHVRGTGRPSLPGPEDARARPRRRARPPRGAARVGRAPRRIPGRAAPPPSALAKGLAPPRLARTVSCGQLRTLVARCSRTRCTAHLDLSKGRAAPIPAGRIALGGLLPPSLPQPPRGRAAPRTLQGRLPHRWDKLGRGGRQSYFPLPSSKIPIGKMVPSSPRALFLLLLILACPEPRASQVSVPPASLPCPARRGGSTKAGGPGLATFHSVACVESLERCLGWGSVFRERCRVPHLSSKMHRGPGAWEDPG